MCDWDDPDERAWLIDDLVTDAQRVLDALDGSELTEEQAQAAALLAVVAGQDVEADPKVPGRWRIARRVVPGRVISTVDPEARHARKSRSRRSDGYKAHICAEPDTGLITAVELATADIRRPSRPPPVQQDDSPPQHHRHHRHRHRLRHHRHHRHRHRLRHHRTTDTTDTTDTDTGSDTADTDTADTDTGSDTVDTAAVGDVGAEGFVGLVLADSAYASGEALDAFAAAGYGTAIKPIDRKPRIAGGFTRDDFTIDTDTDAQTVTCPAGHTKAIKSGAARASARWRRCPLRARSPPPPPAASPSTNTTRRCANKTRWAQPQPKDAYRQHRPMAERSMPSHPRPGPPTEASPPTTSGSPPDEPPSTSRASPTSASPTTTAHSPCEPPRHRTPRAPARTAHSTPQAPTPPTDPGPNPAPAATPGSHSPRRRFA